MEEGRRRRPLIPANYVSLRQLQEEQRRKMREKEEEEMLLRKRMEEEELERVRKQREEEAAAEVAEMIGKREEERKQQHRGIPGPKKKRKPQIWRKGREIVAEKSNTAVEEGKEGGDKATGRSGGGGGGGGGGSHRPKSLQEKKGDVVIENGKSEAIAEETHSLESKVPEAGEMEAELGDLSLEEGAAIDDVGMRNERRGHAVAGIRGGGGRGGWWGGGRRGGPGGRRTLRARVAGDGVVWVQKAPRS